MVTVDDLIKKVSYHREYYKNLVMDLTNRSGILNKDDMRRICEYRQDNTYKEILLAQNKLEEQAVEDRARRIIQRDVDYYNERGITLAELLVRK